MILKGNQPSLLAAVAEALAGPDSGATWAGQGKGHSRRERRSIRTAPPPASAGRTPRRTPSASGRVREPTAGRSAPGEGCPEDHPGAGGGHPGAPLEFAQQPVEAGGVRQVGAQ